MAQDPRPAALFDLDGTLTDPKPGITRSIQYALERLGEPVPEADALTWMIGPPLEPSFAQIVGPGRAAEAVRLYRERYAVTGLYENEVIPGIPDCLERLRGTHRLFVATSKPHVYGRRIVEHFGLMRFFEAFHGSELDGTNADKRDLLRHLVAVEGLDPTRTVMIGDREHDVFGAAAVGSPAIGVLWGYGSEAELEAAGAAAIVTEVPEIDAAVDALTQRPSAPRLGPTTAS
ncbi:MAG TPA: HAD hydrolase-like protein [Beijerinckiaceae bacterium]